MKQIQRKKVQFMIFVALSMAAMLSLLFSYYVQYIEGAAPCYLCLWQRWLYYSLFILSVIAIIYPRLQNILYKLLVLNLLISVATSGYHYGVENMIFAPTKTCTINSKSQNFNSVDEMKQWLEYAPPQPDCRSPGFKLIGVSMTAMNLLWSIALLCFCCSINIFCKRYSKDA